MELHDLELWELAGLIKSGETAPAEVLASCRQRAEQAGTKVNPFISSLYNEAGTFAASLSGHRPSDASMLWGVPYALKDNICTKGIRTTCASAFLSNFTPPYSAHVHERLEEAGGVLVGKCDMDEFAMGSTSENSALGAVRNPYDTDRVAGGSSGGSAAAVASGMAIYALGSDTGGSVRNPASFCSTTGFKPTYGTVSRYGLIAYGSSLDQIGCLTKSVRDAAIVMDVISGHDRRDSTSLNEKPAYSEFALADSIKGRRLAVFEDSALISGLDAEVAMVYRETVDRFARMGAEITPVRFAYMDYVIPVYYLIACCEASSNLARFDGVRYGTRVEAPDSSSTILASRNNGFGNEVKRRILLGTYALSAGYYDKYYAQALKVRRLIKDDIASALAGSDAWLLPTMPSPAFRAGENTPDEPLKMYLSDIFTVTANLCGMPAISFPAGFTDQGLPVGMQLVAKALGEESIFALAGAFQQETDWHRARPTL